MIDPSNAILNSVYRLLKDQLVYKNKTYPVYTSPEGSYDFVALSGIESLDDSTDTWDGHECAFTLDIVTKANEWKPADSISSQILSLLVDKELVIEGFKLTVYPRKDSITPFIERKETELIYRKVIRIILKLKENG
jgi:hypothetical protein